jgi:hypothetical protein
MGADWSRNGSAPSISTVGDPRKSISCARSGLSTRSRSITRSGANQIPRGPAPHAGGRPANSDSRRNIEGQRARPPAYMGVTPHRQASRDERPAPLARARTDSKLDITEVGGGRRITSPCRQTTARSEGTTSTRNLAAALETLASPYGDSNVACVEWLVRRVAQGIGCHESVTRSHGNARKNDRAHSPRKSPMSR